MPEAPALVATPAYGWWMSAFDSLSPPGRGDAAWSRMANEARDANEAAARHWRALAEMQVAAASQAFRATLDLAASQAERRRQAVTQIMETLWPMSAGAQPQEEMPHV